MSSIDEATITTDTTERREHGLRHDWRLILRHQLGAALGTLVDFAVMIASVQLGLSPVAGTAVGAASGAVSNFWLGRRWIFPSGAHGGLHRQALRYALVSIASLALNTLGEHIVHDVLGIQFILARVAVAGVVGLGWNYPLHRGWVFTAKEVADEDPVGVEG